MFDILGSLLPIIKTNKITLTTNNDGSTKLNVKMFSIDSGFDEIDPAISGARSTTSGEMIETGDCFGIMKAIKVALIITLSEDATTVVNHHLNRSPYSVENIHQLSEGLQNQNRVGKIYAANLPIRKDIFLRGTASELTYLELI